MVRISSENDERQSCRGAPGDGRSAGEPLLSPWWLITGMGFIGGGAIFRVKDSVRGTATAAFITLKALAPFKRDTRAIDEVHTDPRD
jgi:hypothetical protein